MGPSGRFSSAPATRSGTDANGLATRRTLGDWLPDLVICDMLMPDAEGFEVLRTVRGGNSRAKFVMISGASGELSGFLDRGAAAGRRCGSQEAVHAAGSAEADRLAVSGHVGR